MKNNLIILISAFLAFSCSKKKTESDPIPVIETSGTTTPVPLIKKYSESYLSGGIVRSQTYTYNSSGDLIKNEIIDLRTKSTNVYSYNSDKILNKVEITDGSGVTKTYSIEYSGGLISKIVGTDNSYTYLYSGNNLKSIETRAILDASLISKVTFENYNSGGRPSTKTNYDNSGTVLNTSYFTYDSDNNLLKIERTVGLSSNKSLIESSLSTIVSNNLFPSEFAPGSDTNPNKNNLDKNKHLKSEILKYQKCSNGTDILSYKIVNSGFKLNSNNKAVSYSKSEIGYTPDLSTCRSSGTGTTNLNVVNEY